jgi:hypothetical protein
MTRCHVLPAGLPSRLAATLLFFVLLGLVTAQPARPEVLNVPITLGPSSVLNGMATITGRLDDGAAAASLSINGAPVSVNAAGTFAAVVDLEGKSSLDLRVTEPSSGNTSTVSIPLNTNVLGPGGVIPSDVLDAIERAAVSILQPVGGFISDGTPIQVGGNVLDRGQLGGLTVNGVDVLDKLTPDGGFSVGIPGTTRTITVVTTDTRGVSTTTTYPVAQPAAAPTVVAAAQAVGVKVAAVRYVAKPFRKTKRLQMIVTVKDSLGRLVKGATVQVLGAPQARLKVRNKVKKTGKLGRAFFLLTPRPKVYGKRLFTLTIARTPSAKTQRKTSVRVPKLRKRAKPARKR